MAQKTDTKRKFKDYYQILGIERSASDVEIETAYYARRDEHRYNAQKLAELETGYNLLRDAELRKKYDEILTKQQFAPDDADDDKIPTYDEVAPEETEQRVSPILKRILILTIIAGIVVGAWIVSQNLYRWKDFAPGDTLYTAKGEIVGTVSMYNPKYEFPNGRIAPAYLVLKQDETEIWYPVSDVRALYTNIPPKKH